jgi:Tfp pilus assembly protein PilO
MEFEPVIAGGVKRDNTLKSKTILVILIVAMLALFGVYYFLGTGLIKQRHSNETLAGQLAKKSEELAQTLKPSQDLDARLDEAEQNLADAIGAIPSDLNSTLVINDILKLAEACQVNAIPLTAGPWTEGNAGYRMFSITMSLTGDFTQVYAFLDRLENVEFKTIIIQGLSVSQGTSSTAAIQANLDLAIYSRYTPAG